MCTSLKVEMPEDSLRIEFTPTICPMYAECHHDMTRCPLKAEGKYDESLWLDVNDLGETTAKN